MGSGTAVAREAADLVLGDDSFATLMDALREGRRMIANVQKGLVFLLSTHVALLGYILVATIAGFGTPLLPIQILWMEFFIDLSATVAFEREGHEPDVHEPTATASHPAAAGSRHPGRDCRRGRFHGDRGAGAGPWQRGRIEHASWLAFTTLVVGQLVRANANRSLQTSLFRLEPNGVLMVMGVLWVVVQATIPYIPAVANAFEASPLNAMEWALVAFIALAPAVLAEVMRRTGRTWVA